MVLNLPLDKESRYHPLYPYRLYPLLTLYKGPDPESNIDSSLDSRVVLPTLVLPMFRRILRDLAVLFPYVFDIIFGVLTLPLPLRLVVFEFRGRGFRRILFSSRRSSSLSSKSAVNLFSVS